VVAMTGLMVMTGFITMAVFVTMTACVTTTVFVPRMVRREQQLLPRLKNIGNARASLWPLIISADTFLHCSVSALAAPNIAGIDHRSCLNDWLNLSRSKSRIRLSTSSIAEWVQPRYSECLFPKVVSYLIVLTSPNIKPTALVPFPQHHPFSPWLPEPQPMCRLHHDSMYPLIAWSSCSHIHLLRSDCFPTLLSFRAGLHKARRLCRMQYDYTFLI
jgi:hypothetical protein